MHAWVVKLPSHYKFFFHLKASKQKVAQQLTFVFLCISVELSCSEVELAVVRLVLGFHPATAPGICTDTTRLELQGGWLTRDHWQCIRADAKWRMQGVSGWVGGHDDFEWLKFRCACFIRRGIKDEVSPRLTDQWAGAAKGGGGETDRVWWWLLGGWKAEDRRRRKWRLCEWMDDWEIWMNCKCIWRHQRRKCYEGVDKRFITEPQNPDLKKQNKNQLSHPDHIKRPMKLPHDMTWQNMKLEGCCF